MTAKSDPFHVAIIGAGPAGLFAAEHLAKAGAFVTVYDHKPSPARKFLMAGRGGLNITHSEPFDLFLSRYGQAADFLRPALQSFTPQDMRDWCAALGEETFIGTSGRVFPKSFKASPLLRAWLRRLDKLGVRFCFQHRWLEWDETARKALFTTPEGDQTIYADALLLAVGGASWPRLGSDAGWVQTLQKHDIKIIPFEPANCGFFHSWSPAFRGKYAGTPLKSVSLSFGSSTQRGEVMITQNGVEGGGIYALSAALRQEIAAHGTACLVLDLKPDYTLEKLALALANPQGRDSLSNHLRKRANLSPVAIGLLMEDRHLSAFLPQQLAERIKSAPLALTAPFPLDRAISSAGGIARTEINGDFSLKMWPHVFVAGEMIDWEAPTGGYLLQASFATGRAAAEGILAKNRSAKTAS